jgi:arsenate reductase
MDTVLFACVHNAGRSQMAAAWFNKMCVLTKARAISAGTQPGEHVQPEVVQVMREEGIDLTGVKPQFLSPELAQHATLLVSMGCGVEMPAPTYRACKSSTGLCKIPRASLSKVSAISGMRFGHA